MNRTEDMQAIRDKITAAITEKLNTMDQRREADPAEGADRDGPDRRRLPQARARRRE